MHEVDVDKMMSRISAHQYREWMAYERAAGTLDLTYDREILAQIHEVIQVNNLLTGASMRKRGQKNPAGKFRKVKRAHEIHLPDEEEEPTEDEDFDEDYEEEEEPEPKYKPGEYNPAMDPFA